MTVKESIHHQSCNPHKVWGPFCKGQSTETGDVVKQRDG